MELNLGKAVVASFFLGMVIGCSQDSGITDSTPSHGIVPVARNEVIEPNILLSRPLGRSPNDDDLDLLESLQGKTGTDVIKAIGHPKAIRLVGGNTQWDYDWFACCYIQFVGQSDIVDGYFYTGGY